jgi:hypothetical protein
MNWFLNENELPDLVVKDDHIAFTKFYTLHVNNLNIYGYSISGCKYAAEEKS